MMMVAMSRLGGHRSGRGGVTALGLQQQGPSCCRDSLGGGLFREEKSGAQLGLLQRVEGGKPGNQRRTCLSRYWGSLLPRWEEGWPSRRAV